MYNIFNLLSNGKKKCRLYIVYITQREKENDRTNKANCKQWVDLNKEYIRIIYSIFVDFSKFF